MEQWHLESHKTCVKDLLMAFRMLDGDQPAAGPSLTPAASMPAPEDPTISLRRLLKAGQ